LKQIWSDEVFRILEIDIEQGAPEVPKGMEFIDPDFRPIAEKAIQLAIKQGEPYNQDWIVTTAKGNKKWVNAVCSPKIENGKVIAISGSFQDITSKKIMEGKLKTSEKKLKAANQQLQASEQQLRATNQQLQASEQQLRAANQQLQASEQQLRAANQQLQASEQQLRATNQQLQASEQQLKIANNELKKAQQITHVGSWHLDIATNEVIWSKELYEMYGFDPSLPVPPYTEHMKLFTPESWDILSTSLAKTAEKGIPYELELKTVKKDKTKGWMWVRGEAIYDENKKIIGLWGAAQDITERKNSEEHLKLLNQQLAASEQQLKAANQLLRSNEEQLIKAKEKAEKSEESLFEANEQLKLHNDRLEAITKILNNDFDSQKEMLDYTLLQAINLTDSKIGYIYFYNEEKKEFTLNTWSGEVMKECKVVDPKTIYQLDSTGCWGEAVRQRKPFIVNDYALPNIYKKGTPEGHVLLKKFLTIPVIIDNEIKAVIGVGNKRSNYIDKDVKQLSLLMNAVWKIVEKNQYQVDLIKAKDKAIKSEKYLENIIENIADPIFVKDEESRLLVVNNAFCQLFGLNKRNILGKNLAEEVSPEERESFLRIDKMVLNDGIENINEESLTIRGGFTKTISTKKSRFFDEKGRKFLIGIIRDITERKQSEIDLFKAKEKAEESEKKHKSMVSILPDGVIIHQNGIIIYANEAAAKICKTKHPDDLLGLKAIDFVHADYREAAIERIKHSITTNSPALPFEEIFIGFNNEPVHVYVTAVPFQLDGKASMLTVFTDISNLKKTEQELIDAKEKAEKSEEKFKLLNRLTSEILLLHDMERIFSYVSENLKNLFPDTIILIISIDESSKQTKLEAISGLDNSLLKKIMTITGFNPIGKTYKLTDFHNNYFKSGNFIEFHGGLEEFSASEVHAFTANTIEKLIGLHKIYTIGINKDDGLLAAIHFFTFNKQHITDGNFIEVYAKQLGLILQKKIDEKTLIKAKEKAEESDRLKSAFLANMSHEIRTPMNGILGFTSLLQEPNLTGSEQQKYIEIIQKSGVRMLNTVNDIIDISKIEAGQVELSHSEVNITDHLKELHSFFKPEAIKKGIDLLLKTSVKDTHCKIVTDFEKFNSIVTNLIKNAIKFTNEGFIEYGYHTKNKNEYLELEFYVKDTGIGIPKDRQQAIFERFIQADINDKLAHQGSGLGLAISKAYAEMLGGKIWVESEEGKGSCFYFTIVSNNKSESVAIEKSEEQILKEDNESNKFNILVVEDDETSKQLISIIVEKYAKTIIYAVTGSEAVEICRNNPNIDLILMDIQLPKINGYEASKQIRQFNKNVVIIAQTAYALTGDKEKAISAGCNDYISKPINKNELRNLINKHLKK